TKIYIGNLDFSLNNNDLQRLFKKFVEIRSFNIPYNRNTNQSKGYGIVSLYNHIDAQKAITEMNGRQVVSRVIRVKFA
ncbi:hypothetical protein BDA99DRAFT_446031, partial [Phascolomyces articulosus]